MNDGISPGSGLQAAVADRLDALASWKVRYWAPAVLGIMMMGDSWDVGIIGYVMPSMRHEWALSTLQVGGIISAGFAGQSIGALLFGPLAERFGRIGVLTVAVTAMSLLSIACALAPDPQLFTWLRFAQGVGFGGAVPVCVSYVNELAPTATRGRYFSLFQFLMVSGFALCGFVSAVVIPAFGWRWMFALSAFPVLCVPLILFTLPESPRWLARLGRVDATNRSLIKLGAPPLPATVAQAIEEKAPRVPISALFTPELRGITLSTGGLWFLVSLVSYAFSTWTPTLYVDVFHLKLDLALRYAAYTGIAYMMTPLVFALVLDRFGRRSTGITVTAGALATLALLVALGQSHPASSVFLMAVGWTMSGSIFVLLWPYSGEVFPTKIRSTALGLCSAIARLGSTVTPLAVAGTLSATGSIVAVFGVLAAALLIVLLLWLFGSREMAGQRLDTLGDDHS